MEAQYRAGRAYQQHARGGTSGGNVPVDIHPRERVQEMEGGEVEAEVAWLARWRATRDGSPRFLSCGHDEQKKRGDDEICSTSMHRENYEPKAALVEPGVWPGRAKEGSNDDRGTPGSAGLVHAREQQPEWEREQHNERRGASSASRSSRAVSLLPCLFVRFAGI
jgi:hypothetical protein